MEFVKGFFESFKEFIWDIIGYLLPGCYILILLSVCVNKEYFVMPSVGANDSDFYLFVFIVISYLIGYVIYGFGWLKDGFFKKYKLLNKFSYIKKIEDEIANRPSFSYSKELLGQALLSKNLSDKLSISTVRDVRNLVMSFIPESDQKIYTFTFRAELSNQTGNASIIVGFLGLFFSVFKQIPLPVFKTDTTHIIIYFCLIISYFLLRKTRDRFYAIAISLPFSIYTANQIKK